MRAGGAGPWRIQRRPSSTMRSCARADRTAPASLPPRATSHSAFLQTPVGIDDKFPGDAFIEVRIALGRVVQSDDRRVDRFRDLDTVVQNRHHQGAVVL